MQRDAGHLRHRADRELSGVSVGVGIAEMARPDGCRGQALQQLLVGDVESGVGTNTSSQVTQYVTRCLSLYAPTPSSIVARCSCCIGSLAQGSDRMRSCRGYPS